MAATGCMCWGVGYGTKEAKTAETITFSGYSIGGHRDPILHSQKL